MEISFEFAKKINKYVKGMPGISLRSISGDRTGCTMIIMAESYDDIRSQVQNYRLLTARSIKAAARGKSLEIKAEAAPEEDMDAISLIFDFAGGIRFNSEDAIDTVEFCRELAGTSVNPALNLDFIELSEGSMWLDVSVQIADEADPDTIYGAYESLCEKYGAGMIKKRPD